MCRLSFSLLLSTFCLAWLADAKPTYYEEYPSIDNDVTAVGSQLLEIRQRAPLEIRDLALAQSSPKSQKPKKISKNSSGKSDKGGHYKIYGSDAEGEKGYLEEDFSKGNHGYKNLDTFHKQGGDKYGYEKHSSYGRDHGGKKAGHHGKSDGYSTDNAEDHEGAGTDAGSYYSEGDEGGSSYYSEAGDGGDYDDGQYAGGSGESGSYGGGESYSEGDGEEGSYENHSSYSSGSEDGGESDY